jgi:hypothetical protein
MLESAAETISTVFVPNRGGMPYLEPRRRAAVVAFCCDCEFAIELLPTRGLRHVE